MNRDVNRESPITRAEFDNVLKSLNNKKATGMCKIPAEILKNLGEGTKKKLYNLINDCYKKETIPSDFVRNETIVIPKKGNSTDCDNYRTNTLLSHTSKVILSIIKNRIKRKIELNLEENQFGIRSGRGTKEAIPALRLILERRIEVNRKIHMTFIELEKAFDRVDWELLFTVLKNSNNDWRNRRTF